MPRNRKRGGRSHPSQRQLRVGELIRHALAELFAKGEIRDPGLEGLGIDHEQPVALFDIAPRFEVHAFQKTLDPGAHLHRLDRLGGAGELQIVGHLLL